MGKGRKSVKKKDEQSPDVEEGKDKIFNINVASLTLLSAFVGSMSAFGIFVLNFLRYVDGQ